MTTDANQRPAKTAALDFEQADLDIAAAAQQMARWRSQYEIAESADGLYVAAQDPFPIGFGNCVVPLGTAPHRDPGGLLSRAERFFEPKGRGYTLWIRDHLDTELEQYALSNGYTAFSESPGLVLDAPVTAPEAIPDARIEVVTDVSQASLLGPVVADGYGTMGMPQDTSLSFFAEPERLLGPHLITVLGYFEERPAAAAFAILNHGVAGIYWVATSPEARGHGLADACTRMVSNHALKRGASAVYLQASAQGDPIYRRMGYREFTRYRWLLKPA